MIQAHLLRQALHLASEYRQIFRAQERIEFHHVQVFHLHPIDFGCRHAGDLAPNVIRIVTVVHVLVAQNQSHKKDPALGSLQIGKVVDLLFQAVHVRQTLYNDWIGELSGNDTIGNELADTVELVQGWLPVTPNLEEEYGHQFSEITVYRGLRHLSA